LASAGHVRRFALLGSWAIAIFALAVLLIFVISGPFLWPHGHDNTLWVTAEPGLNYSIDVAIGVLIAGLGLGLLRFSRRRATRNSPAG